MKQETGNQPFVPTDTVETILALIQYVADPTRLKGEKIVEFKGQDGQLIYQTSTSNGKTSVTIVNPVAKVVKVGTQPSHEQTSDATLETVYILDESRDFGDNIVEAGTATGQITETSYKLQLVSSAEVSAAVKSNDRKWSSEIFWHKDETQVLPSDRIIIDKLYLDLPTLGHISETDKTNDTIRDYVASQLEERKIKTVVKPVIITNMLDTVNETLYTMTSLTSSEHIYNEFFYMAKSELDNIRRKRYATKIIPIGEQTTADAVQRYHNDNMKSVIAFLRILNRLIFMLKHLKKSWKQKEN